tara:strand:- start:421 stop:531 length:111 start_codon:yes stop_codon:yes gene_type:complete
MWNTWVKVASYRNEKDAISKIARLQNAGHTLKVQND